MEWFEYIIIVVAVGLVLLPIALKIINKKRGKSSCASGCCCCPHREGCCSSINKIEPKK